MAVDRWFQAADIRAAEDDFEDGGFEIVLDGKPIRAKSGRHSVAPSRALAEAIAAEWNAVGAQVDFQALPLTRLFFMAADLTVDTRPQIEDELSVYAGTDLVSFRADRPAELGDKQEALLEPVCLWAEKILGAPLPRSRGVVLSRGADDAVAACRGRLQSFSACELASVNVLTRRAGSVILALAVHDGEVAAEQAWALSRIEEDWQRAQWGDDDDASRAAEGAQAEFLLAARFLALVTA